MNIRKVQREHIFDLPTISNRKIFQASSTPDLVFSRNSLLSPVPVLQDPQLLTSEINHKEIKKSMTRSKEALINDIKFKIECQKTQNPENFFHKSKNFIQRKHKIEENVKNHKYNSCEKLSRVKSIVDYDSRSKEFITKDDMLNEEAVEFLNLNKRNFGQAKNAYILFRSKKKKGEKAKSKILSLPNFQIPDLKISNQNNFIKAKNVIEKKTIDNKISPNVKNFICKEMRKLWPPEFDQINKKKQKILKAKIEKLEDILEKDVKGGIEDEILKGLITTSDKMKMDEMVNQHFRNLRKKLTVFA